MSLFVLQSIISACVEEPIYVLPALVCSPIFIAKHGCIKIIRAKNKRKNLFIPIKILYIRKREESDKLFKKSTKDKIKNTTF